MCCAIHKGAEYSRSFKELIEEAKQLVDNGTKEITLLGQNVNAYNYEKKKLSDLILEISKIKDLKELDIQHPSKRFYTRFNRCTPRL